MIKAPEDPNEDPNADPNYELRLRQVFIRKEYEPHVLHRDQIRALNVMRGQSKCDSLSFTPAFLNKITTTLALPPYKHAPPVVQKKLTKPAAKPKGKKGTVTTVGLPLDIEKDVVTEAKDIIAGNPINAEYEAFRNNMKPLTTGDTAYVHAEISKYIATKAPITVNINPHIIKILIDDGIYRSTFEVNASKGAAYLAGRIAWESACFLGLYDSAVNFDRCKYGALNYLNCPQGILGARGYGRWHFTLNNDVRRRCTLATGDTAGSRTLGVLDFCDHVLVELHPDELRALADVATGRVACTLPTVYKACYREIQIHGELNCGRDVASLHVPRSEVVSADFAIAEEFSRRYNVPIVMYD